MGESHDGTASSRASARKGARDPVDAGIADLVHDLRNPLAGLRGALQIIRERVPEPGDREIIDTALKRVDDMLGVLGRANIPRG